MNTIKNIVLFVTLLGACSPLRAQDSATGIKDPRLQHHLPALPIPPSFPGGKDSLTKYLAKHVHYPAPAAKKHITGTVTVTFMVDTLGKLYDIKVTKPLSYSCDKEALRVIKAMPKWVPCMDGRRPKAMDYYLDITFAPSEKK